VINVGHINRPSLECKFQFPKPHFSTSFAALALFCPNDDNDLENQNLIPSHLLTRDTERERAGAHCRYAISQILAILKKVFFFDK